MREGSISSHEAFSAEAVAEVRPFGLWRFRGADGTVTADACAWTILGRSPRRGKVPLSTFLGWLEPRGSVRLHEALTSGEPAGATVAARLRTLRRRVVFHVDERLSDGDILGRLAEAERAPEERRSAALHWCFRPRRERLEVCAEARARFGLAGPALEARAVGRLIHPSDRVKYDDLVVRLTASRRPQGVVLRLRHADGTWRPYRIEARWARDGHGCAMVVGRAVPAFVAIDGGAAPRCGGAVADGAEGGRGHPNDAEERALSAVARGLAHAFNNSLAVVRLNLDLLFREAAGEEAQRALRDASAAVERCAELMRDLVETASDAAPRMAAVDAEALLRMLADLLRSEPGRRAPPLEVVCPTSATIAGDTRLLLVALRHLVANAEEASGDGRPVRLEACVRIEPNFPGGAVALAVRDAGEGMTPEVLRRAREPFFTTRHARCALGLGLTLVDRIARRHGGSLRLSSAPGEGTTAMLVLPRYGGG